MAAHLRKITHFAQSKDGVQHEIKSMLQLLVTDSGSRSSGGGT